MAEQLNHTDSEVLYFDFSKTSMEIAQHRSKFRGGLKIVWVIDWIESIPRLGLGSFDLAVSTGVLHHLKSPQKGLKIVNDAQTPDGGAEFIPLWCRLLLAGRIRPMVPGGQGADKG